VAVWDASPSMKSSLVALVGLFWTRRRVRVGQLFWARVLVRARRCSSGMSVSVQMGEPAVHAVEVQQRGDAEAAKSGVRRGVAPVAGLGQALTAPDGARHRRAAKVPAG
jgi:hypothetical protein